IARLESKAMTISKGNPWDALQFAAYIMTNSKDGNIIKKSDTHVLVSSAIDELERIAKSENPLVYVYLADLYSKRMYDSIIGEDSKKAKFYLELFEQSKIKK
ncbi:MAG: hypothetical protein Q8M07_25535, partial [Prosthecobacter sp.]|nr:hypothetical protein [Prosthecobacter sp.]